MRLINSEDIKKAIKINRDTGKQEIDSLGVLEVLQKQQEQIDEVRKQMLIFLGVLEKLEESLDRRYSEITEKANSLELGAKTIKESIAVGVSSSAKEIIKDLTETNLNKVIEKVKTAGTKATEDIDKAGKKLETNLKLANIFNHMSWVLIIVAIGSSAFTFWKMREFNQNVDYKLNEIRNIQQNMVDLTVGNSKYWFDTKEKKLYLGNEKDWKDQKNGK